MASSAGDKAGMLEDIMKLREDRLQDIAETLIAALVTCCVFGREDAHAEFTRLTASALEELEDDERAQLMARMVEQLSGMYAATLLAAHDENGAE